ncbi:hypothetical protein F5144DRAFT_598215 [Chaetomium tenue]|uniref:Uncharacterized protein n=1 Tax=Chaetomium tenue TaxID=1854479 RepID=A0ACB7PR60_9PEZI|nr:hypothetical protein F5144DRAFT_598215 [Chaetomium globosum]
MLIPQLPRPKTAAPVPKPQIHTHKNHHTYNGTLKLPQSTHVRIITEPPADNHNSSNNTRTKPDPRTPRYVITLHYPHNRACELYRTALDMKILQRALHVPAHSKPIKINNTSSSKPAPTTTTTTTTAGEGGQGQVSEGREKEPPCKRTCSCPCACAAAERQCDYAREAAAVQLMLGQALGKMEAAGGEENGRVGVPMEWFLRRRLGDCGL